MLSTTPWKDVARLEKIYSLKVWSDNGRMVESPSLERFERFKRCVDVALGDMVSGGSAGLTAELKDLGGLLQPK